jgi:hypothetical protein
MMAKQGTDAAGETLKGVDVHRPHGLHLPS